MSNKKPVNVPGGPAMIFGRKNLAYQGNQKAGSSASSAPKIEVTSYDDNNNMDIKVNYYTEAGSVIFEIMNKKDIENFNENANTIFQMESNGTIDSNLVPKLEVYNNKVSINYANGSSTYLGELPFTLELDIDDIENVG